MLKRMVDKLKFQEFFIHPFIVTEVYPADGQAFVNRDTFAEEQLITDGETGAWAGADI